jgi:hypothetical protein
MKSMVEALAIASLAFALGVNAQVQTTTTTTTGKATKEVQVEHGEVVTVAGNDLVVKMEDGTIRDFPDISESARIDVNGKQLGIHDLKPGMKLQRTTITTTTPKIITTVQTVTGKVWHVSPPNSVILTLENGQNQSFKIPKDQKFNVNGKMVDAFGLKKGMNVTATKIVEVPETVVAQQKSVTGTMPTPPTPPPADAAILIVEEETVTEPPSAPATAPTTAPETPAAPAETRPTNSNYLLLAGLVAFLALIAWLVIRSRSKART